MSLSKRTRDAPTMNRQCYLMVGNPGTGKSIILNGLIGEVKFKSGFAATGAGVTTMLQIEDIPGKGTYMDTPGLSDEKLRKIAAAQISQALKQDGFYRIFFVVTLEAGRVRPDDKATISLVLGALKDVPNLSYSIIINKLSKPAMDKIDYQMFTATLMENLPVVTSSIYFMRKISEIEDEDQNPDGDAQEQKLRYTLPQELNTFIHQAPGMNIAKEHVQEVKPSQFDEMKAEFGKRMEELKGNLDEQKKVNESLHSKIDEANKRAEEQQKQAAQERKEMMEYQKKRDDEYREQLQNIQESHKADQAKQAEQLAEMVKQQKIKQDEADARMRDMQQQHEKKLEDMADAHAKERQASGGGSGDLLDKICGAVPVVGDIVKGIRGIFKF